MPTSHLIVKHGMLSHKDNNRIIIILNYSWDIWLEVLIKQEAYRGKLLKKMGAKHHSIYP